MKTMNIVKLLLTVTLLSTVVFTANVGDLDVKLPFDDLKATLDYENLAGRQVYFFKEHDAYMFTTFTGDNTSLKGETYIFTSWPESSMPHGVYAGITLGNEIMHKSDMVTLHYKGGDSWMNGDCWCDMTTETYYTCTKLDQNQVIEGENGADFDSTVQASFKKAWIKDLDQDKFGPYTSVYVFHWERNLNKVDRFDWEDIKNWQTNNGVISGAFGLETFNEAAGKAFMDHHTYRSKISATTLVDGSNFDSTKDLVPPTTQSLPTGENVVSLESNWTMDFDNIKDMFDYKDKTEMYIYHFINKDTFLMSILTGDSTKIEGKTYALTTMKDVEIMSYGVYAGISFGTDIMRGSDMVTLHYQGENKWMFGDCYVKDNNAEARKVRLDTYYSGGDTSTLNTKGIKGGWIRGLNTEKWGHFTSLFVFEWVKEIPETIDEWDWAGLKEWKTSNSKSSGAFGPNKQENTPGNHGLVDRTNVGANVLTHGSGIVSTFSVDEQMKLWSVDNSGYLSISIVLLLVIGLLF